MAHDTSIGEFEHLVLLAVLKLDASARAIDIRRLLEESAQRRVSRGALYATLERLEKKRFLTWRTEKATPARGGHSTPRLLRDRRRG